MDSGYTKFLEGKAVTAQSVGFDVRSVPDGLFPFQKAIVKWACKLGRAAVFADTGLGKTAMQLAWADAVRRKTKKPVLILAPLAVGPQTLREAGKFGVKGIDLVESQADVRKGICVTNYQKVHKFDAATFGGIVLDESSILKQHDGQFRNLLIESFARTPYRLCCTATPAPNDHTEIGNHCEFLGLMSRVEMLATYFVHDSANTSEWRLKGHAVRPFWEWVASWAMMIRRPEDIGFEGEDYNLPPVEFHEHVLPSQAAVGELFATEATDLNQQRKARRESLDGRVAKAAEIAGGVKGPCLVWCELNDEGDDLEDAIPGAVQVAGKDSDEDKAARLLGFADGSVNRLVTKAKIAGFGMNWQNCSDMVFVGLSHSYEQFYQAVRRCWRYGQKRTVNVHVVTTDREYGILANVRRKQSDHDEMFGQMIRYTKPINQAALKGTRRMSEIYKTDEASGEGWDLKLGDCVERIRDVATDSIDYSVFSPPFASLYTYSNSDRDMGNCLDHDDFAKHFGFLTGELLRVMKPGRLLSFHCMNLPLTKERDGVIGIRDFRGEMVRLFVAGGWVFHSEVCIWKDPVTAMQRTKALGLLHKQIKKDSCMSRQGIADYVVTMRKPGKNPDPVTHTNESFPVERWQRYASPVWMDINQTDTLNNYRDGREDDDERHICPLQLGVIERCVELWTNPGDLVLSPFAGIGSEGYQSLLMGRRFLGFELKPSYYELAKKNLARAVMKANEPTLFDVAEAV
jgi:superfamily II DNA or RNA helicase